jgi:hypothetical protein
VLLNLRVLIVHPRTIFFVVPIDRFFRQYLLIFQNFSLCVLYIYQVPLIFVVVSATWLILSPHPSGKSSVQDGEYQYCRNSIFWLILIRFHRNSFGLKKIAKILCYCILDKSFHLNFVNDFQYFLKL